ncbi:hypothetical protein FA13DRAFT_1523091 [Coprinellus micaceus]|uniref:Uncharacterized protein n=1 Tax=Coprinellus micaceus TaxID=71717 RepID=A0A4Y7SJJ6_COPMI|nr:hypothetical protein FA13DRAFT_1523091 [Coprinellus micaceus]
MRDEEIRSWNEGRGNSKQTRKGVTHPMVRVAIRVSLSQERLRVTTNDFTSRGYVRKNLAYGWTHDPQAHLVTTD